MKFKATMTIEYEVRDEVLMANYGSTDPKVCAEVYQVAFEEDPGGFLVAADSDEGVIVKVEAFA
jgi:hypothetical protein